MKYVIRQPEDWTFQRAGVSGKAFETETLSGRANFLYVETENGHSTTIVEKECDFVYFVISGSGEFTVDSQVEKCRPGDLVAIPKGSAFSYKGSLKMLLSSVPAWWPEQELTL